MGPPVSGSVAGRVAIGSPGQVMVTPPKRWQSSWYSRGFRGMGFSPQGHGLVEGGLDLPATVSKWRRTPLDATSDRKGLIGQGLTSDRRIASSVEGYAGRRP